MSGIALEGGINANLLSKWRREHLPASGQGTLPALKIAPAVLLPVSLQSASSEVAAAPTTPASRQSSGIIEIDIGVARVRLRGSVDKVNLRVMLQDPTSETILELPIGAVQRFPPTRYQSATGCTFRTDTDACRRTSSKFLAQGPARSGHRQVQPRSQSASFSVGPTASRIQVDFAPETEMPSQTAVALTGFIAWALILSALMEGIRSKLVLTKALPANGFTRGNANLSSFMERPARAHANCLEVLPIFGA